MSNHLGASPATMGGQAGRVSAAQKAADEAIRRMQAQGGTLTAQVQVVRKGTGKVENWTLVFKGEGN